MKVAEGIGRKVKQRALTLLRTVEAPNKTKAFPQKK
jgi:hypothetical protein